MVKAAWQTYHKSHKAIFQQGGSYDLISVFSEMAHETSLLNVKIYEVQEVWTGWQGPKAANHATNASQRDIQFFHIVTPTESPNIMGIKGVHSPRGPTLVRWPLLLPLVWKGRLK